MGRAGLNPEMGVLRKAGRGFPRASPGRSSRPARAILLAELLLLDVLLVAGFGGPAPSSPGGTGTGGLTISMGSASPPAWAPAASNFSVGSFTITPSTAIRVTQVNFSVNVTGGLRPLTYVHSGLPYGCPSYNGSRFYCFPGALGTFHVEVQVTDLVGNAVFANATLIVTPGGGGQPKILSFEASPGSVMVHRATYITVDAVSQSSTPTAFLAYAYYDLPPGCASFNQTNLTCLPSQPGTYQIQVQVTDGFGAYTYGRANLTVVGGASSAPAPVDWAPWFALAIVLVVAAITVPVVIRRRRTSRAEPPEKPPGDA